MKDKKNKNIDIKMLITQTKISNIKSKIQLYKDLCQYEHDQDSSVFDLDIYSLYNNFKTNKDYEDLIRDLEIIQNRIINQIHENIWKETERDNQKNSLSIYRVYYPVEIRPFYSIRK